MIKQTGSFNAQDEEGQIYTINIFTEIVDAGAMGDTKAVLPSLISLFTPDGEPVNIIEKGKYEIVPTGTLLTSDDPNAP